MASNDAYFESLLNRVREKLKKENIKLWLPPYTSESEEQGSFPEELIQRYSTDLKIPSEVVMKAFDHFRIHALEKLAAQKKFSSTGVATVKVHLAGNCSHNSTSTLQIQTELSASGADFKRSISRETGLDTDRMKVISCGHVVDDDQPLETQFVKNNGKVMVLFLSESEAQTRRKLQEEEQATSNFSRMRHTAEVLANRTDDRELSDKYYLEINDQNGRSLQLPNSERKALALALALHEKGKSALKQKKYAEALLFLLDADKEFNLCRSEILRAVDNFAIVCLDVVWCYFWLKSISDLPNAEERLKKSKECFEKSYGKNLERLEIVRGGTSCELALFVRLFLLQGICAYHRGNYEESATLIAKADEHVRQLKPDDNKLTQLLAMGFSMPESRLALRACRGDVTLAVSRITQRREEKNKRQIKEKEEREKKRLASKLGKTANGDWVNLDAHRTLVEMGYSENAATEGLRQASNNISQAIQILQENPALWHLPDISSSAQHSKCDISDEAVAQVMSIGFEMSLSCEALVRCQGNIQRAVELLISSGGSLPPTSSECSHGSISDSEPSSDGDDAEVEAAVEELVPDLTQDEEAYLDLTLEDETAVIEEYKALLTSNGYSF